jgi:hypothetical protein
MYSQSSEFSKERMEIILVFLDDVFARLILNLRTDELKHTKKKRKTSSLEILAVIYTHEER